MPAPCWLKLLKTSPCSAIPCSGPGLDSMRHIEKLSAGSRSKRQAPRARPGEPFPLGATWDGRGTNFSVFSEVATRVELCLFSENGTETRIDLPDRTAFCWNGYIPG